MRSFVRLAEQAWVVKRPLVTHFLSHCFRETFLLVGQPTMTWRRRLHLNKQGIGVISSVCETIEFTLRIDTYSFFITSYPLVGDIHWKGCRDTSPSQDRSVRACARYPKWLAGL